MSELFHVSSSPHVRAKDSTSKIMLWVIISMLPMLGYGTYNFGLRALLLVVVTVLSCVATEYLFNLILKRKNTIGDLSAVVTGMILGLNMPVALPIWEAVLGGVFAIAIVKMMFGGTALLDAVLSIGLVSRLLSALIIFWGLYLGVEHWFSMHPYCRRLQRQARGQVPSLTEDEDIRAERRWQSRAWHRRISFVCSILLIGAWLCSGFVSFIRAADDKNTLQLAGNEETLPFALMQDLYEDSTFSYSAMDWTNEIRRHDDILIPVHLQVLQNGTVTFSDGTSKSGGLTVRYIETVSEDFTDLLVRQYRHSDERDKHFGGYRDLSPEVVDRIASVGDDMEVFAYTARFPTVLIRHGKTLLYVNYYGDAYTSPDAVIFAMTERLTAPRS